MAIKAYYEFIQKDAAFRTLAIPQISISQPGVISQVREVEKLVQVRIRNCFANVNCLPSSHSGITIFLGSVLMVPSAISYRGMNERT